MSVVLIGSNPGALLYARDRPSAFVSIWSVDWSRWGRGDVAILATSQGWITVGTDEHFARILAERFTRHFPEAESFRWTGQLDHISEKPSLRLNPATGVKMSAPDLKIEISGVLDRRYHHDTTFALGSGSVALSNVYMPCSSAQVVLQGVRLDGEPQVGGTDERPSSSAFLAIAEVWTDPHGVLELPERPPELSVAPRPRHLRSLPPEPGDRRPGGLGNP